MPSPRPAPLHRLLGSLFATLSCAAALGAAAVEAPFRPLDDKELAEVFADVDTLVRGHDQDAETFSARGATPERMDRFFADPDVSRHDHQRRTHALIFAGNGQALRFERPSDVMAKMSRWFPDDLDASRVPGRDEIKAPQFHGPFTRWSDEAVAFTALWNCSPRDI